MPLLLHLIMLIRTLFNAFLLHLIMLIRTLFNALTIASYNVDSYVY